MRFLWLASMSSFFTVLIVYEGTLYFFVGVCIYSTSLKYVLAVVVIYIKLLNGNLQYQCIASMHNIMTSLPPHTTHCRSLKSRVLRHWVTFVPLSREERAQESRRAQLRRKVASWLQDYSPNTEH